MRERWAPGGEQRLRAGALRRRPPVSPRRPVCLFVVRQRRSGGSGVLTGVPGGGRWARGAGTGRGGGCGLRGTETLLGVRARAAGPRPSIVPAALAAGLAASSSLARCGAPRGSSRGAGALAAPASAPGPQPRSRGPAPGRRGSGAGWGWGCGHWRPVPGGSASGGLRASRGRGGLAGWARGPRSLRPPPRRPAPLP